MGNIQSSKREAKAEAEVAMPKVFSLPEDIQVDIFLRLPVNSILICKWVCKTCRNLIRSRKYIKYHLNLSIQENNSRLMVRSLNGQSSKPNIYTIDYALLSSSASYSSGLDDVWQEAFQMDYPFECNDVKRVWILDSCNGLICLGISSAGRSEFDEDSRMYVWNPTTREYKKILIKLNDLIYDLNDTFYNVRYGFGYDCNTDDYKVVRIDDYASSHHYQADVYSLVFGVWKAFRTIPYSFRNTNGSVLFNGALHWLGGITNKKTAPDVIVSFDVSKEILVHVPFPKETMQRPRCKYVGVLADCLCLYLGNDLCTEVWVMLDYGVRETWTKQFTFTRESFPGYVYLNPIWSLRNGEIVIVTNYGLILYDRQNGNVRDLNVYSQANDFSTKISHHMSYVQTLVSLGSASYVGKTTRIQNGHMELLARSRPSLMSDVDFEKLKVKNTKLSTNKSVWPFRSNF